MTWKDIEPKVEDLQAREVATMTKIEKLTASNNRLPSIPLSFTSAKNLVADSDYNVVVCGEVKKGKSSLLNAIIGKEILPVNSEIATSQVFRISNSENESFFLVFSDGSRQSITKEELARYGSQVDANLRGEPVFSNRTLSYIQVNIPIAFLPKGVSLVDTPGLGALYKSHEYITQNYVSNASAILFVLDPERPIEAQEKKFILKALDITEDILFVMTKIDLYTPEAWNSIFQRNEAILADIYAEKGALMPTIKPVSSVGLMKASKGAVQALKAVNLKNSKFPELKAELIKMMFRGVGILRTGLALKESADQTTKAQSVINDMLKMCIVDNQKEQQELNARKLREQDRLKNDWGQQSEKRQQVIEEIGAICSSVQSRIQQIVSTSGSVYKEYEAKINSLSSMEAVEKLGKSMAQEVINDVSSQWQSIANQTENRVAALLSNVSAQIGNIGFSNIGGTAGSFEIRELSVMEKVNCWRGAAFVGSIGTTLAATIGAFAVPVIGPIIGGLIAFTGWLLGRSNTESQQIERNKQNFRQKLIELLNDLSVQLLHVQEGRNRSVVGQFVYDLNKNAQDAIKSIYEGRQDQMQHEMDNLERQARADMESRKRDAEMWNNCKREWDLVAKEIQQQIILRKEINDALK